MFTGLKPFNYLFPGTKPPMMTWLCTLHFQLRPLQAIPMLLGGLLTLMHSYVWGMHFSPFFILLHFMFSVVNFLNVVFQWSYCWWSRRKGRVDSCSFSFNPWCCWCKGHTTLALSCLPEICKCSSIVLWIVIWCCLQITFLWFNGAGYHL